MHSIPIYTVDAFSNAAFGGNPAAVCLLHEFISDGLKQKIAFEMNLSETAFIEKAHAGGDFKLGSKFSIRWFTPTHEVDICGHATVASAAVLFKELENPNPIIQFESRSGLLGVKRDDSGRILFDFPQFPIESVDANSSPFKEAIKAVAGQLPIQEVVRAPNSKTLLIVLQNSVTREELEAIGVNYAALHATDPTAQLISGVMITAAGNGAVNKEGEPIHFLSRCFAPWVGINEDPVTGSSFCILGPYWKNKLGKTNMIARQCSQRGGDVYLHIVDDSRVEIGGHAKVVLRGTIEV